MHDIRRKRQLPAAAAAAAEQGCPSLAGTTDVRGRFVPATCREFRGLVEVFATWHVGNGDDKPVGDADATHSSAAASDAAVGPPPSTGLTFQR